MTGLTKTASDIHAPANDVPMVIGATASAIGCLALSGTAIVQGYVEGEIRADTVLITTSGKVVGTIVAADVIIEGAAVDALIFGERIVLRDGSQVTGEIWHKELVLEAGHMFEGKSRRHDDPRSLAPADPQQLEGEFE